MINYIFNVGNVSFCKSSTSMCYFTSQYCSGMIEVLTQSKVFHQRHFSLRYVDGQWVLQRMSNVLEVLNLILSCGLLWIGCPIPINLILFPNKGTTIKLPGGWGCSISKLILSDLFLV